MNPYEVARESERLTKLEIDQINVQFHVICGYILDVLYRSQMREVRLWLSVDYLSGYF
jgi:hypothetical protein